MTKHCIAIIQTQNLYTSQASKYMLKSLIHAAVMLISMHLISCKAPAGDTQTKQALRLPDSLEEYYPYNKPADINRLKSRKTSDLRIYTLVDVSCSTCILKLGKWNTFYQELKNSGQQFPDLKPICFSEDHFETLKYLFESNQISKIDFPLLLDVENKFIAENHGLVKMGEMTVLTNARNEVLLAGNPIENHEDREKFLRKITETNDAANFE